MKSVHSASDVSVPPKNPEDLTTNEVRQGVTGNGVRYVLLVSLVAALVALGLTWMFVL
jgi:hypothetical protein